ncbi:MAG: ABC transporter ATP-binding protein [Kiritimatiellaeota bacterium]|nr:ABC transporter ATP-binding protein [Kiritimatiellota bacterium]
MVIEIKDLRRRYQMGGEDLWALAGVSLGIEKGDFVAIMGPSGSGKSTLLNILGCLDQATSGEYILDGISVAGMSRADLARIRNSKIGFVFQNFNLLTRTSALDQVQLPVFYSGPNHLKGAALHDRAAMLLTQVGLGGRLHHTPAQLSGGQQQRVAIARALMNDPPLLLADEPTGNLDSKATVEIMEFFCRLNAEGQTIVMVTHDDHVAHYTKRRIIVKDGRIAS